MTKILTFGFFNFIRTCQNLLGRASTQNCKLWLFHIKSRVEKKMVPNLHFWAKCFGHFDDLQSNLFFPRSVRIDFSRSVVFYSVQRDLLKEIRFFTKKSYQKSYRNGKKHKNLHKTVIRRTFRARS